MVLSNYVATLLTAYLGSFLKDINKDSVNVSILRGFVELRNVELSPAITEGNDFFRLQRGVVGYLKVAIPWHSLNKKSCSITIKDVSVLLSTHKDSALNGHEAQKCKKKLDQLDIEAASSSSPTELDDQGGQKKSATESTTAEQGGNTSGGGSGYFERLQQNIIANFSFSMENVVVRIEETAGCYEGKAAAAALSFQRIFCEPTDKDYQPQFISVTPDTDIHRRIQYEALTAVLFHYSVSGAAAAHSQSATSLSVNEFAQYCRRTEHSTPFLESCQAEIRVAQSAASKSGGAPTFRAQYHSVLHETRISENNIRAIRALMYGILGGQHRQLLVERPLIRPSALVPGSVDEWWAYVLHEVRAQVRRRRRKSAFSWEKYLQRKQQCNDYFGLCLQKLTSVAKPSTAPTSSSTASLTEAQHALENSLPLHDLLACRRIARIEAKKDESCRLLQLPRDFREMRVAQTSSASPSVNETSPSAIKTLGFNLTASVQWDVLRAAVDGGLVAEINGFHAALSLRNNKLPSLYVALKRMHLGLGACKRVFTLSGRTRAEDSVSLLHYMNADGGGRTIVSGNELRVQINADPLGGVVSLLSAYEPLISSLLASAAKTQQTAPSSPASPQQMTAKESTSSFAQGGSPLLATKKTHEKTHTFDLGLQLVTVSLYEICVIARNLRSNIDVDRPPALFIEDLIVTVHGGPLAYVNSLHLRPGGEKMTDAIVMVQGDLRVEDNLEGVEYIKETLRFIKERVSSVFASGPERAVIGDGTQVKKEKAQLSVEVFFPRIVFLDLELQMLHICVTLGHGWRIHMTSTGLSTSTGSCAEADLELVLWADGFLEASPYAGSIVHDGIAFHFEINNAQLTLDDKLCATAEQLLDLVMLAIFNEDDSRVYLRDTDRNKLPCLCGTVSLSYATLCLPACESAVPTNNPLRTLKIIAQDHGDVTVSLRRFRDKEMYVDVQLGDGVNGFLEDTVVPLGLFPLRRGSTVTVKLHVMPPCLEDVPIFPYSRFILDIDAADKAVVIHLPTVMTLWDHFNTSGAGLWRMRCIGSRVHFSSRVSRGRVFPPRSPRSKHIADVGQTMRLAAEARPNPNVPTFEGPYSTPTLPGDLCMAVRFTECELYYMWGEESVAPLFLHSNVAWCRIDITNHDCCTRVELSGVASLPRIACSTSVSADGTGNEEPNGQSSPVFAGPGQRPMGNVERRRAALAMERDEETHTLVKLIYTNDTRPPFDQGVADESMMVSLTGCVPRGTDGFVGTRSLSAMLSPAELAAWCTMLTFFGKEATKQAEGPPQTPPPAASPPSPSPPRPRRFLLDLRFAPAELYVPALGSSVVLWHGGRFRMEPGCNTFEVPHLSLVVHRALQQETEGPKASLETRGGLPALRQLADEGYAVIELGPSLSSSSSSTPGLVWRGGPLAAAAATGADEDDDVTRQEGPDKVLTVQSLHVRLSEAVLVELQNTQVLSRFAEVSQARTEQESWLMDVIRCRRHVMAFSESTTAASTPPRPAPPSIATLGAASAADPPLRFVLHRVEFSVHWLSYCCERTMAALTCVLRSVSYSAVDSLQIASGRVEIASQKSQAGRQRRRRHAAPFAHTSSRHTARSFSSTCPPHEEGFAMVPRVLLPRLCVQSTRQRSSSRAAQAANSARIRGEGEEVEETEDTTVVLSVAPVLVLLTTSTCTLLVELSQRLRRVLRHYNDAEKSKAERARRCGPSPAAPQRPQAPTRAAFYGHIPRLAEEIALWKLGRRPSNHRNSPDLLSQPSPGPGSPLSVSSPPLAPSRVEAAVRSPALGGFSVHESQTIDAALAAAAQRPVNYVMVMSDLELHCVALERAQDEDAFHAHVARNWTARVPPPPPAPSTSSSSSRASHHHPHPPGASSSASSRTRGATLLPNVEEALRAVLTNAHTVTTALSSWFTLSLRSVRISHGRDGARSLTLASCTLIYPRQALRVLQMHDFEVYMPNATPSDDKNADDARAVTPAPLPPSAPAASGEPLRVGMQSLLLEPRASVAVGFLTAFVEIPLRAVSTAATKWHRAFAVRRETSANAWELLRTPPPSAETTRTERTAGAHRDSTAGAARLPASRSSLSLSFARLPASKALAEAFAPPRPRHHPDAELPPPDSPHTPSISYYGTLHVEHIVGQTWRVTQDLFLSRDGLVLCFSNAATNHLVVDLGGHAVTVDPAVLRPGQSAAARLVMVVDSHMTVSFTNGTFRLPATAWTVRLRDAVADAEGGGVAAALVPFVALSEGSYLTCGESVRITFFADDDSSSSTASDADEQADDPHDRDQASLRMQELRPDTIVNGKQWVQHHGVLEEDAGPSAPPYAWRASRKRGMTSTTTHVPVSTTAATAPSAVRPCHFYVGNVQLTQQDCDTARCLRVSLRLQGSACVCEGQLQRDDIHVDALQVETFAIDAPSRATYTTVLAPTSLTVTSSDGAHHAVSVAAVVMDVTREDVVHFAGVARTYGELRRHVQHLNMTDAEKHFSQCLRDALAWRRLSPAAMASTWASDEGKESDGEDAERESGAEGRESGGGSPVSPYRKDGGDDGRAPGDEMLRWHQDSSVIGSTGTPASVSVLKSSLAVFIPLVELTLSDPRYPLLRARAHGVFVRRKVMSANASTLEVQNEDLGLEVYGKGRWDTILLPTASLQWSHTATTTRHSSTDHAWLRADGLQVQCSHMVLFKVRFAAAHALLVAKSFQSTFSAATPQDGDRADGLVQDEETEEAQGADTDDDSDAALRAMAEAVARVSTPTSPVSVGAATTVPTPTSDDLSLSVMTRQDEEEGAVPECGEDPVGMVMMEESESTRDRALGDHSALLSHSKPLLAVAEVPVATDSISSIPPPSSRVGLTPAAGALSTATHRFHNAYNCVLFLLLATDAGVPAATPTSSVRPPGGGGSDVTSAGSRSTRQRTEESWVSPRSAGALESSARSRQQIDSEVKELSSSITPTSRGSAMLKATTMTGSATAATAIGTSSLSDEEGQLLQIQPGCSVDVLIPYKRAHDLYLSLVTADCVQWSRGRQRFELNAQGRALDLSRTRVCAATLQYGSATGLLLREALVVLSCADEQGSAAGDWDTEELTGSNHTLVPQWQLPSALPQTQRHSNDNVSAKSGAAREHGVEAAQSASESAISPVVPSSAPVRATNPSYPPQASSGQPPLQQQQLHGFPTSAGAAAGEVGGLLLVRIHAKHAIKNETGIPVLIRVCEDGDDDEDVSHKKERDTEGEDEGEEFDGTVVDSRRWRRHTDRQARSALSDAAKSAAEQSSFILVASGQQLPFSTRCLRVVLRVQCESSHSHDRIAYEATLNTQRAQSGCFIQLHRVIKATDESFNAASSPRPKTVTKADDESRQATVVGCRDDLGLDTRPLIFFVVTRRIAESLSNFIYLYPRTTVVNHVGVPISVGLWQDDPRAGPQSRTDATLLEPWLPLSATSPTETRKLNEKQRAYRRLITLATHRHVPHRGALPIFQCDYSGGLSVALSFSQSTGDRICTEDVVAIITSLEDAIEHHPRLLLLRDSNGNTFFIQVAVLHRTIILSAAMWVYNYTEYPLLMSDSIVTRSLCAGQNRDTGIIPSQGAPFVLGVRLQDFTQVFIKVGLDARWSGGVAMDVGSKGVFESVQNTIGFTRSCNYAVQLPNAREGRPMTLVITPRWIVVNRTNKKLRLIFDCPGLTKAIRTSARLRTKLEKREAQRAATRSAGAAGKAGGVTPPQRSAAEQAWRETFGALSSATSVVLSPGEHHVSCIGTIAGNTLSLREELAGMVPTVTSITDHGVQHKDLSKFYECQQTDPVVIDNPGQATFNLWAAPRPYMKRRAVSYGGQLDVYRPPHTFSASAIEAYDPFLADAVVTGRVAVSVRNTDNVLAVVVQPMKATQIRVQNRCLHNTIMVRQQGSRRRNMIQPCRNQFFMWEDSKGERVLRLHMTGYKGKWFEVDLSKGDCHVTRCTTLCHGREGEYYHPFPTPQRAKEGTEGGEGEHDELSGVGDPLARGRVWTQGTRGHLPFHVRGFTSADQSGATILVTDARVPLLGAGGLWRTVRTRTVFLSYLGIAWVMEGLGSGSGASSGSPTSLLSSLGRQLSRSHRTSPQGSASVQNLTVSPTSLSETEPPPSAVDVHASSPSSASVSRGVLLQTIVLEGVHLEWLVADDSSNIYAAVHQIQMVDEVAQHVFFYRARLALPLSAPTVAAGVSTPAAAAAASATAHEGSRADSASGISVKRPSLRTPVTRRRQATTTTTSTAAAAGAGSATQETAAASRAESRVHSPLMSSTNGSSALYMRSGVRGGRRSAGATTTAAATASTSAGAREESAASVTAQTWSAATQQVADAARSAVGTAWSLLKGSAVDESMVFGEPHDVEMRVQLTQYADGMVRVSGLQVFFTPFVLVLSDAWIAQVLQETRRTQATLATATTTMRQSARQPMMSTANAINHNSNANPNSSFHMAAASTGSLMGVTAVPASSSTTHNVSFRSVGSPLAGGVSASSPSGANLSCSFPTPSAPTATARATATTDSAFTTQTDFVRHVVDDLIDGQASVAALAMAVAVGGGLGHSPLSGDDGGGGNAPQRRRRRLRARFTTSVQTQKGVSAVASRGGGGGDDEEGDGGSGGAGVGPSYGGAGGGAGAAGTGRGSIQSYFRVEEMAISQVSIFITLRRHHPDPLRPLLGVYTLMLPTSLHQRAFHLSAFALQNSVETTASLRARLAQWAIHSLRQQWTKATKIGALIDMFAWGRRNLPLRRPPQALTLTRAQYLRSRQLRNGGDFPFLSSSSSSASSSRSSSKSPSAAADADQDARRAHERDAAAYRAKLRSITQHRHPRVARRSASGVVVVADDDVEEEMLDNAAGTDAV